MRPSSSLGPMIGPEQLASRLSGLPPLPPSVFDDREGCPICAGPPGECVRGGDQEYVDEAARIRAFVEERSKLQTRGPRKIPEEARHDHL
jgi:hypothetical protein